MSEVYPYGLEAETEFLKAVFLTPYVKNHHPVSTVVISKAGTGKSYSLMRFDGNKGIYILNDVTAYGIMKDVLPSITSGEVKHIIIPDFLKIMERDIKTANELVSLLNTLSEEGLKDIHTFYLNISLPFPVKCAFATAITDDAFKYLKKRWRVLGFSSRVLPFLFNYSDEDLKKAREDVRYSRIEEKFTKIKLPIPDEPIEVSIKDEYLSIVASIADYVANVLQDYTGFRTERNLVTLIKAHALVEGRTEVKWDDLIWLRSLVPFWYDPIYGSDVEYSILRNLPASFQQLLDRIDKYSDTTIWRHLNELVARGIVIPSKSGTTRKETIYRVSLQIGV